MVSLTLVKKYKQIKNSLLDFSSKEFFIFLFFLATSATFWFISTLNDTYEKDYPVRVEIIDVPKDIVITESLPDTIRVILRDKGFNLLKYSFGDELQPIQLHFPQYAKSNGKGIITQNDIQKVMKGRMEPTTSITSVKSDRWEFFYSLGTKKRVPIVIDGQLIPASNYYVSRTVFTPDSATVYASATALDTIYAVYTKTQNITNIKKSETYTVELQPIMGAKIDPQTVKMSLFADQMTEVNVNVPIKTINVPEGVSLKTFPARIDVRVAVGLKQSSLIKPEQFTIVADYNDINDASHDKVAIRIQVQPKGIVRASLKVNKVDYIIEK